MIDEIYLDLLDTIIDTTSAEELRECSDYLLDAAGKRHESEKMVRR